MIRAGADGVVNPGLGAAPGDFAKEKASGVSDRALAFAPGSGGGARGSARASDQTLKRLRANCNTFLVDDDDFYAGA